MNDLESICKNFSDKNQERKIKAQQQLKTSVCELIKKKNDVIILKFIEIFNTRYIKG